MLTLIVPATISVWTRLRTGRWPEPVDADVGDAVSGWGTFGDRPRVPTVFEPTGSADRAGTEPRPEAPRPRSVGELGRIAARGRMTLADR